MLTKLLLQNPTILILDEPTNYLDVEHIQWLTNYLKNYENAFILVSHDIPFLNDVDTLLKNYPALYPNDKNKLQTYQKARNDIIRIISDHTL